MEQVALFPGGHEYGAERKKHAPRRNKVRARVRALECVRGVLEGHTYQEVADRLGYANRGTVHRIVQQALDRNEAESVHELRALELARLDALQSAYFQAATAGDAKAAELVLKVMGHRARLLQLDRPSSSESRAYRRVVVVGGSKEDYIAALKSGHSDSNEP